MAHLRTLETFEQRAQRSVSTAPAVVLGNINLTNGFCVAVIRQVIGTIESIGNIVALKATVVLGLDGRVAEDDRRKSCGISHKFSFIRVPDLTHESPSRLTLVYSRQQIDNLVTHKDSPGA